MCAKKINWIKKIVPSVDGSVKCLVANCLKFSTVLGTIKERELKKLIYNWINKMINWSEIV